MTRLYQFRLDMNYTWQNIHIQMELHKLHALDCDPVEIDILQFGTYHVLPIQWGIEFDVEDRNLGRQETQFFVVTELSQRHTQHPSPDEVKALREELFRYGWKGQLKINGEAV